MNGRKITYIALFIALSFLGAQIKLVYSIALDAMPAFLAAALLGPVPGAVVGVLGHLLTAFTSGFPFTLPIHLIVAASMGLVCWVFGKGYGKLPWFFNVLLAVFLNGVGATFVSVLAMQWVGLIPLWQPMFLALVGPLLLASSVNVALGGFLAKLMEKRGAIKEI